MIEDCVLHSLVVWLHLWHFVPVKYRQISSQHTGLVTGPAGTCRSVSSYQKTIIFCSPVVLGKHRKGVCVGGMKWSLQQKKLQPSVLNSTGLLPHHIYKTPNRLAPAVLHVCFSLLPAPCSVFSLSSAHLAASATCSPISSTVYSVLWSPAEEESSSCHDERKAEVSASLIYTGGKGGEQIQVTAFLILPACELCQIPLEVKAHLFDQHMKHTPISWPSSLIRAQS